MSLDKHLLEILVCPATKTPVKLLAKDKLAILNREVDKGAVAYVDGSPVDGPLDEALITEDGRTSSRAYWMRCEVSSTCIWRKALMPAVSTWR